MQIQSQKLLDTLIPGTYQLRSETRDLVNPAIDYTEAVSKAVRGEIEAIATPAGRIKYLRLLSESERPKIEGLEASEDPGSTAFAQLNIGAYREAVRGPKDEFGCADVIGHVWALSLLRGRV